MKICGIVCEYNPFHNGHLHHIAEAKRLSSADAIVCILGENFTQRGEAAFLPASVRAKHAILGGADAVISLPTVFASSPAEIFARGAVKILASLPDFSALSFGAEHANTDFFAAAKVLLNEEAYAAKMKSYLAQGVSFARARAEALFDSPFFPLLSSPNDVLAAEYAKAILRERANVSLFPVDRRGDYKSVDLPEDSIEKSPAFSSAAAIRQAVRQKDYENAKKAVPPFVTNDLKYGATDCSALEAAETIAVLRTPTEEIAATLDCTEGIENALLKAAKEGANAVEKLTSRRYTSSRIRRILLQNLLGIRETFIRECLSAPLYIKPLAIKKGREDVLAALSRGTYPCIVRKSDEKRLTEIAKRCMETDRLAQNIYSAVTGFRAEKTSLFY